MGCTGREEEDPPRPPLWGTVLGKNTGEPFFLAPKEKKRKTKSFPQTRPKGGGRSSKICHRKEPQAITNRTRHGWSKGGSLSGKRVVWESIYGRRAGLGSGQAGLRRRTNRSTMRRGYPQPSAPGTTDVVFRTRRTWTHLESIKKAKLSQEDPGKYQARG